MRKYWSLFILIPFLGILSCMDDTSAYLPQDKEQVNVDEITGIDTTATDTVLPEGELVPGMHLVKLNVMQGGELVERRFKYYMPVTLNPAKPISLIFEFHGSYEFEKPGEVADPIAGLNESNAFCQKALKENCILCYPAGVAEFQADSSGAVNWAGDNYEKSLPFVDAMVKYFTEDNEPRVDPNRIYSTGQSSGAIFSFVLALHRPEVFAAITPRAGQSASTTPFPSRAVPVRVFAGEADEIVNHNAVIDNMTKWAEKIGGYFAADMQMDSTTYEGYADVTIRYWHGGNADYEIYSLAGIGHGISFSECLDDMWDFMKNHTLNNASNNLFVTTSIKEIDAQCGEPFEFEVSCTAGAKVEMDAPQSWNPQFDGKKVTLVAPQDFFGNIERDGAITFSVTLDGETATCEIPYHLNAPKAFFEVGDIYYNEKFESVGVVCWVNSQNIREAKIITLTGPGKYGTIWWCGNGDGLGLSFDTPDRANGEQNTQAMVNQNKTLSKPFTASDAAFMWAAELGAGWYLPAIEELAAMAPLVEKLNAGLTAAGGSALSSQIYSSTTKVLDGASTKTIYTYNFKTKQEVPATARDAGSEYFGFISVRGVKKVMK